MSETLKTGDRIRVTIEGEYTSGEHIKYPGTYGPERLFEVMSSGRDTVTVEKIEPPVVVFKPGDRVRDKAATADHFLVLNKGYVDLTNNIYNEQDFKFTSEHFERVE